MDEYDRMVDLLLRLMVWANTVSDVILIEGQSWSSDFCLIFMSLLNGLHHTWVNRWD